MSMTNESMTEEQQSSAEILDGLFRELEEKSAKGELPVESDLSTVLGNSLTNEDLCLRNLHRKRKSSKQKHTHRHKKQKKHRKCSQTNSGSSSDEWVPAEEKKLKTEIKKVAKQCSNPPLEEIVGDDVKIAIKNPMCSIAANPDVAVDRHDVSKLERLKPECNMPNVMTLQKNINNLGDGLIREVEENSSNGELPVQSDLSVSLEITPSNEDLHQNNSHRKRKSSKHKHPHKHKRHRKSHQPLLDNSCDEWVPAEGLKYSTGIGKASQQCSESPLEAIVEDVVKIESGSPLCILANKPDVTLNQMNVNDLGIPSPECDKVVHPDFMPSQTNVKNLEVSKSIEKTVIQPNEINQQDQKRLCVHNEQVLFLPRVTCLDRRASQRKPVSDHQVVVPLINTEKTINDESLTVTGELLNGAVTIGNAAEKECKSSSSDARRGENTLGNYQNMDDSNPKTNKDCKKISKLKSKISCLTINKASKKLSTKPKTKTEKKELSKGKDDSPEEQKLHSKSQDKKRKLKKRSKSTKSSRSRSRQRSSSPRNSCSHSRSTSKRSHSRSPKSQHSHFRSRQPKSTRKAKSRSNSRERNKRNAASPSRRLRARDRTKTVATVLGEKIDKAKLLEIARKNAMAMMAEGKLPVPVNLSLEKPMQEKVAPIPLKANGKSVEELTDFCKLLAKREKEEGELSAGDSNHKPYSSDEDDKGVPFVHHHPFKLKEQPSIIMNIRNAVQIPIKTPAEKVAEGSKLRIQFPVSSGTQHRKKEWVPVSPKKAPEVVKEKAVVVAKAEEVTVFQPQPAENAVDIGAIVSQRLKAVRKLMDNPHDVEALNQMYKSQQQMQNWAQSKQLPGQFTGTTDVQILTPEQLAGPAHLQAWVKKDQFNRAAPVQGGFGMYMLQKMGWKPGEGLGKNKEGSAEPIILDIKTDKKGLVSQGEVARKNVPVAKDLSGKHPVSALVELCSKRRWLPPEFILVHDSGPDHNKNFVFKVQVNGQDYQPAIASLNKKHAKAQAASVCLQAFGLVPRDVSKPL